MDALISTIIVMVPLLLIWFWGRWRGEYMAGEV